MFGGVKIVCRRSAGRSGYCRWKEGRCTYIRRDSGVQWVEGRQIDRREVHIIPVVEV